MKGRAQAVLRVLLRAPITRAPHAPLMEVAWKQRANLSLYDAVYCPWLGDSTPRC